MLRPRWAATAVAFSVLFGACGPDGADERSSSPAGGDGSALRDRAGHDAGGVAGDSAVAPYGAGAAGDGSGLAGAPGTPGEGCELVYATGHGDLFIHDEPELQVSVRAAFGSAAETLEQPGRVCVVVPPASHALARSLGGVPAGAEFEFLGLAAGSPFWLLPATPRAGMPWLGASTERLSPGRYVADEVVLSLTVLERPEASELAVWSASSLGHPNVLFATSGSVTRHALPVAAHLHFNWGFTHPGEYAIELQVLAAVGSDAVTSGGAGGEPARTHQFSRAARLRFLVQP